MAKVSPNNANETKSVGFDGLKQVLAFMRFVKSNVSHKSEQ